MDMVEKVKREDSLGPARTTPSGVRIKAQLRDPSLHPFVLTVLTTIAAGVPVLAGFTSTRVSLDYFSSPTKRLPFCRNISPAFSGLSDEPPYRRRSRC